MMTGKKHKEERWNKMAAFLSGEDVDTENLPSTESAENEKLARYWKAIGTGHRMRLIDTGKAWEKVQPVTETGHTLRKAGTPMLILKIAAALLILAALGTAGLYLPEIIQNRQVSVATSGDEFNREVILPDGTRAWLYRNSRLSWPHAFRGGIRNVNLNGEAFFEVTPDRDKPFIVKAGKEATVRVTGTSFNVAYSEKAEKVEVYVETGSVILSLPSGESLALDPGYIGVASDEKLIKSLNENRNYMAWKTGLLVYEDAPLSNLLPDLEKTYGIGITAEDPSILDYRITTTFDHDPAETIVNVICITFNIRYVKDGDNYRLMRK